MYRVDDDEKDFKPRESGDRERSFSFMLLLDCMYTICGGGKYTICGGGKYTIRGVSEGARENSSE